MKITTRLALIVSSLLLLFVAGTIVFQQSVNRNGFKLANNRIDESEKELSHLLLLHGKFIGSFVYDNTQWDDMVDAVLLKKMEWLDENFKYNSTAEKLDINYLWIYNANGNIIFKNQLADKVDFKFNPAIFKWNNPNNYPHFFTKLNNQLIEIYAAPIQPSNDGDRKTLPRGFMIAGHIFDSETCAELEKYIDNSKLEIRADTTTRGFDAKSAKLTLSKALLGSDNQPVAYLKLTRGIPVFKTFTEFLRKYNIFFVAFSLIILILLIYFIMLYINTPLNKIFKAMNTNNDKPIIELETRKDEFGQLSRLISLSFKQKKRLVEEIDERKKSEESLLRAYSKLESTNLEKQKAERAEEAKSGFISNISHELRTPMNAVVSIANMLALEKLDDKQSNLVKVLNFSARQLTTLVSDILDFSKIESGELEMDEEPFNLFGLCNEMIQMLTFSTREKNIELHFDEDESLEHLIIGDPHRLNQILINLLTNAIKFTEKGRVDFSYRLDKTAEGVAKIKFSVKDTGIGIAADSIHKVFDRFNQGDSEVHKKFGGSGLGLTLSKKMVELMGGNLEVESELGKGSTFYFTLVFPLDAKYKKTEENKLASAAGTLEGLKVLVAEDHEINAFVLKQFFKQWKVEGVFAENGKLALDELEKQSFDLVLMDLQMPVMDGVEAVKIIRSHPQGKYKKLSIVALTANSAKETREFVLRNGFDLFISKPFDPTNLHQILYNVKKYSIENKPDVNKL